MEQTNDLLSPEEYKQVKEWAYHLADELSEKNLTIEEFDKLIDTYEFSNEWKEMIFKSTVRYPNDVEILHQREIGEEQGNKNSLTYLCESLNIPEDIMITKIMEYNNNDIVGLLKNYPELYEYAQQPPYYETQQSRQK